jgi:hypothetical protein
MTSSSPDRSAHPLAQWLWRQLRNRSELDRRYVFDLLQARLGLGELGGKREVAAEALQRFIEARTLEQELGASKGGRTRRGHPASWALGKPSRRSYDAFRKSQPDLEEWPSSSFIRNAFDNDWGRALAAVGSEPAVDITSRRLVGPKPYSKDEVLNALRIWIAEVDEEEGPGAPLMQSRFEEWATTRRSTDDPRFNRLPSKPTIYKVIGDWRDVLVTLDCTHRHWQSRASNSTNTDGGPLAPDEPAARFDLESAPPNPPRRHWHIGTGDEAARAYIDALLAWLRWLAEQLPEEQRAPLRAADFDRYMSSIRRLSLARGNPLHPPSHSAFEKSPEIDSWLHAKYLAGMIPGGIPAKRSTKSYTERELIDAVIAAQRALGPKMSRAQYTKWRDCRLSGFGGANWLRVPSESLIRGRFSESGRWHVAIENAICRATELGLDAAEEEPMRPEMVREEGA